MNSRILLGALAGVTALVAIPSAANAAATCSYSPSTRTMTATYSAGDSALTVRNGQFLQISDNGVSFRNCGAATAANTDSVVVRGPSGQGAAQQTTTIDERSGGDFAESNPKLHFTVLTGTNDRLVIREGGLPDAMHLMDQSGLAQGPAIDLDYDGDIDIRMTTGSDSIVQVNGGGGADFIDATSVRTYHTVQLGEAGNDGLLGGHLSDSFDGGPDQDTILAKDGIAESVKGGTEADGGTFDFNLDQLNSIERPGF
jgi:hypothetical protein